MTARRLRHPDILDVVVEPLLTAQDVMAQLKVKRTFVTAHAAELGALRVGGRLRFHPADVEAYLKRCRVQPLAFIREPASEPPAPRTRPALVHKGKAHPITGEPW